MKNIVVAWIGIIGGWLVALAGGWDSALKALIVFMVLDYMTGMIVAGVFHKSKKTENGALSSYVGLIGVAKKVVMLFIVVAGQYVDIVLGVDYFRDAVIIALVTNELISLVENAGLAGIEIPVLSKAVDLLNEKSGKGKADDGSGGNDSGDGSGGEDSDGGG
ncbi:MAG: phage holin family protein [Lachnospiraceae bacterium]|nr:phage holin family protein [Lachnospiraceae bacterium]